MYRFLTLEEIVAEQLRQLRNYGGGEPGIIKPATLESAWAAPQSTFGGEYLHEDVYAMAAASLVGFVMGHAFANGNKRIGLAVALEFLYVNGVEIEMTNDEAVRLVLAVIEAKSAERTEDAAAFLRTHSKPLAADCDRSLEAAADWVHGTYARAFEVLAQ